MHLTRRDVIDRILPAMRVAPLLVMAGLVIFFGRHFQSLTVEDILNYTPENLWVAAGIFVGIYAFKSLTVVFPILVLYVAVGVIFPPLAGLLVNLIGLFVALSIPYWIGRFSGRGYMERLLYKFPKARQLLKRMTYNEWFVSYILRVINALPGDLVSMVLGSMGIRYFKYLIGSLIGMAPTMIAATLLGVTMTDPLSPGFFLSAGAIVLLSLVSLAVYCLTVRRQGLEAE